MISGIYSSIRFISRKVNVTLQDVSGTRDQTWNIPIIKGIVRRIGNGSGRYDQCVIASNIDIDVPSRYHSTVGRDVKFYLDSSL